MIKKIKFAVVISVVALSFVSAHAQTQLKLTTGLTAPSESGNHDPERIEYTYSGKDSISGRTCKVTTYQNNAEPDKLLVDFSLHTSYTSTYSLQVKFLDRTSFYQRRTVTDNYRNSAGATIIGMIDYYTVLLKLKNDGLILDISMKYEGTEHNGFGTNVANARDLFDCQNLQRN